VDDQRLAACLGRTTAYTAATWAAAFAVFDRGPYRLALIRAVIDMTRVSGRDPVEEANSLTALFGSSPLKEGPPPDGRRPQHRDRRERQHWRGQAR
jgi:hypothetical protein